MSQILNFLPDSFVTPVGTVLRSLLDSMGEQDDSTLNLVTEGRKELFITTATGRYLVSLASMYGFVVPRWAGLDTNGIRKLAVPSIFLPKQSKDTFKKITEAFYSKDILNPSFISTTYEPFVLMDGDSLIFETETGRASVAFRASQISNLNSVNAGELAGIINAQQNLVYADVLFDRTLNASKLRIISNSYGVEARLRIVGGSAQNILKFPNVKDCTGAAGTTWSIYKEQNYTDIVTFTYDSGFVPTIYNLDIGDIVTIRGLVDSPTIPFSILNGSFEILDVGMNDPTQGYFKIRNLQFQLPSGSFPVTYSQLAANEFVFTSYVPRTIYNNREYALITEPRIGEVLVSVPPVPPLTRLYLRGSAHLHGTKVSLVDFGRYMLVLNGLVDLPPTGTVAFESSNTIERISSKYFYRYISYGFIGGNTALFLPNNQSVTHFMPFKTALECSTEFAVNNIDSPVYLEIDSNIVTVVTPDVPHAFEAGQQISIDGVDLADPGSPIVLHIDGGFLNSDLNKYHVVKNTYGRYQYKIELLDASGNPKRYRGAEIVGFDVYSLSLPVNGADIIFRFASEADRIEAGFVDGMKVRLLKYGTILNNVVTNHLRDIPLVVIYQTDADVCLSSDRATIFNGQVLAGGKCLRSCYVGGTTMTHTIVDPYSGLPDNWNLNGWFKNASILFLDAMIHSNPNYLGSFVYDPIGTYSSKVVSSISTTFDYLDPGTDLRPFVVKQKEAPGELTISSVEGFPPQGEIVVGYGTNYLEGPISYVSYSGNGPYKMFIDRAYVFKYTHGAESEIRLIRSNSAIEIADDGSQYPAYVTDAMSARELVSTVLKEVSASGIKIDVVSQTPDLKFYEEEIDPFVSSINRT